MKTLKMSFLVGAGFIYPLAVSKMKLISCSVGFGSRDSCFTGVSVVPKIILLCQGTAKRTLPSDVLES